MHKIGENVVYGSNGVMTVVDIREEHFGDTSRSYYVLRNVGSSSESLTFVPIDNEKLVSFMRPLLTKEEIHRILREAKESGACEWVNESRARAEKFKNILDSGDRGRIIAMIRGIYANGQKRSEEGKKNYLSDENLMHKAEKILNAEFSIVLGISEEEVAEYIRSVIEG